MEPHAPKDGQLQAQDISSAPPAVMQSPDTAEAARFTDEPQPIKWTAPEYEYHPKTLLWYVILVAITIAGIILAYVLTSQWTFALLLLVSGIGVAFYGARRPHDISYELDEHSLHVGPQVFELANFTAFSLDAETPPFSVQLRQNKRLAPNVIIYFNDTEGEYIVDILQAVLPQEESKPDRFDRIMRYLRF